MKRIMYLTRYSKWAKKHTPRRMCRLTFSLAGLIYLWGQYSIIERSVCIVQDLLQSSLYSTLSAKDLLSTIKRNKKTHATQFVSCYLNIVNKLVFVWHSQVKNEIQLKSERKLFGLENQQQFVIKCVAKSYKNLHSAQRS